MKNIFFLALTTLTLTGALLLTALAQTQLKPFSNTVEQDKRSTLKKAMLPCVNAGGGDAGSSLQVTNSSGQTIKKTMLIYYSFTNGAQGQAHPSADVAPGKSV